VRHGRYTIIRKIAEGGMAEIFLAKQHGSEGFEKLVILKRILTAFYADEQFRNMLIDEAHISMGLNHNNIAQILDVGKAGGRFFLVLELVDGWDLGTILQRADKVGAPLPPGLALYTLSEVCRALSYAHAKLDGQGRALGIVHRDVSPHNVLISDQGEVKIIDFGVAKAMTKRDRTGAGIVKGKIAFMSPEQALGQQIDSRADLYAVGILLYLLSTGRRPFDGPTDMEVLVRVQSGQFTPPEQMNPQLSRSLAYVIGKAMNVDRDQRYQTADELLVDIESIMRSEFGSAGQTALKLWLAALTKRDGQQPVSREQPPRFSKPGSESVEGKSVELGDEDEGIENLGRLEVVGGRPTEPTLTSTPSRRARQHPRITGSEATHLSDLKMSVADEDPRMQRRMQHTSSHSSSDMALPVSDEEPPGRIGRSSRAGGAFKAVVVLGLLGGAGAVIWQFLNRPAPDAAASAAPDAQALVAAPAPVPVPAAAPKPAPPPAPTPPPAAATEEPAPPAAQETPDKTEPPPPEEKRAAEERRPAAEERRPAGDDKKARHNPDPFARARSWQKPEEPVSPGIAPPPSEPKTEEKPEGTAPP
jgi:serine/threonine protein kinase